MKIPSDIYIIISQSLLGYIYNDIIAISVIFDKSNNLFIKIYIDREENEFDRNTADLICTEILSHTSSNDDISSIDYEIIRLIDDKYEDIDVQSGLLFLRMRPE